MKGKAARPIVTILTGAALLVFSGCADSNYSGYKSDGSRAYYDQYVDRDGYYDFGRPVIFVPESRLEEK